MDRSVPLAFAFLGLVLGAAEQLRNLAPAVLDRPSLHAPEVIFLLGIPLFVLSTVGVALVGYWAGRRVDLPARYARFATVAGVAGGIGVLVGAGGTILLSPVSVSHVLSGVAAGAVYNGVTKAISVGLFGLAGASIAHFQQTA